MKFAIFKKVKRSGEIENREGEGKAFVCSVAVPTRTTMMTDKESSPEIEIIKEVVTKSKSKRLNYNAGGNRCTSTTVQVEQPPILENISDSAGLSRPIQSSHGSQSSSISLSAIESAFSLLHSRTSLPPQRPRNPQIVKQKPYRYQPSRYGGSAVQSSSRQAAVAVAHGAGGIAHLQSRQHAGFSSANTVSPAELESRVGLPQQCSSIGGVGGTRATHVQQPRVVVHHLNDQQFGAAGGASISARVTKTHELTLEEITGRAAPSTHKAISSASSIRVERPVRRDGDRIGGEPLILHEGSVANFGQGQAKVRYTVPAVRPSMSDTQRVGPPAPPVVVRSLNNRPERSQTLLLSSAPIEIPDYYARSAPWAVKEGDEEAFKGKFLCEWKDCRGLLSSNVTYSNHLLAHYLNEAVQQRGGPGGHHPSPVSSVDDVAGDEEIYRCNRCFRQMSSPFLLQCHVVMSHPHHLSKSAAGEPPYNVQHPSQCHICELPTNDSSSLKSHMAANHCLSDMAYECKCCTFASSLYQDVRYHYSQEHSGTLTLMCPLCLFVTKADVTSGKSLSSRRAVAVSADFSAHFKRHVERHGALRCRRCRLVFASDSDLSKHSHKRPSHERVRIRFDGLRPIPLREAAGGATIPPGRRLLRPAYRPLTLGDANCLECRQPIDSIDHYRLSPRSCTSCDFQTSCTTAYKEHVDQHKRQGRSGSCAGLAKQQVFLPVSFYCRCGFGTKFGNRLAEHVQDCRQSDGTALANQLQEQRDSESNVDLQEEIRQLPQWAARALRYVHLSPAKGAAAFLPHPPSADDQSVKNEQWKREKEKHDEQIFKAKMSKMLLEMESSEPNIDDSGELYHLRRPQLLSSVSFRYDRRKRRTSSHRRFQSQLSSPVRKQRRFAASAVAHGSANTELENVLLLRQVAKADGGQVYEEYRKRAADIYTEDKDNVDDDDEIVELKVDEYLEVVSVLNDVLNRLCDDRISQTNQQIWSLLKSDGQAELGKSEESAADSRCSSVECLEEVVGEERRNVTEIDFEDLMAKLETEKSAPPKDDDEVENVGEKRENNSDIDANVNKPATFEEELRAIISVRFD